MEQEINLLDVLAAVVRKGRQIIVFALIVGLLFMGYAIVKAMPKQSAEKESYAMAEKERKLRDLEKTVNRSEKGIEAEQEYIDNSLYMQLNPYDIYETRINYALTSLNVPVDGSLGMMENPTKYVTDLISSRYQLAWSGMDLASLNRVSGYEDAEDRYLREVIKIGSGSSGNIYISVIAATEEQSENLADAVEKLLLSLKNDVAKESYSHDLVRISGITKQIIREDVRDDQNVHYDALDSYVDDLSVAQKSINKLNAENSKKAFVKKLIIGCSGGGVLAVLWVAFRSILRNQAESSEQVASQTGLKYLGNAVSGRAGGLFAKLANVITGEKTWKTNEEALSYMAERTAMECGGDLLVTTPDENADASRIATMIESLAAFGVRATYRPSIATNAEALAAMKDATGILFAVTKGKSKVGDIREAKELVEQAGKTAVGYVML